MTATATDSYLVIRAMLDEFARCGMEHACTSPGSRNTPIVLSLAREPRLHALVARRRARAGFFALGAAKASGRPVAVTCTSGTAAANLLPAVIEAHEAGVPLIVLTADRPPELRDVGAGQTIDQLKLYGDAVKWFVELGVPEATPERLRWVALARLPRLLDGPRVAGPARCTSTCRCASRWCSTSRCPPTSPAAADAPDGAAVARAGVAATPARAAALPRRHEFQRTVFVAGDLGPDRELGAQAGGASPRGRGCRCSPTRSQAPAAVPAAIAHFDLILRDPDTARRSRPTSSAGSATSPPQSRCAAGSPD